jgi:hypothetical protein
MMQLDVFNALPPGSEPAARDRVRDHVCDGGNEATSISFSDRSKDECLRDPVTTEDVE